MNEYEPLHCKLDEKQPGFGRSEQCSCVFLLAIFSVAGFATIVKDELKYPRMYA